MSVRFRAQLTRAQKVVSAPKGAGESILRLGQYGPTPKRRWLESRDIWPRWFFGTSANDKDRLRKAAICVAFNGGVTCHWQLLQSHNLTGYVRVLCTRLGIFTRKYTPRGAKKKKAPLESAVDAFSVSRSSLKRTNAIRADKVGPRRYTPPALRVARREKGQPCPHCGTVCTIGFNPIKLKYFTPTDQMSEYMRMYGASETGDYTGKEIAEQFPSVVTKHRILHADTRYNEVHPLTCVWWCGLSLNKARCSNCHKSSEECTSLCTRDEAY